MGCKPRYFLDEMTMTEVQLWLESYNENYKDHKEELRIICHSVYNGFHLSNGGKQPIDIKKILKFPWDEEIVEAEPMTPEETKTLSKSFAHAMEQFQSLFKKKKKK